MSTAEKIEETPLKGKTKEKEEEKAELVSEVSLLSLLCSFERKMLCHLKGSFYFFRAMRTNSFRMS